MVARITDVVSAEPMTLHFTQVNRSGTDKAPVDMPRRLLSSHQKRDGVVRLSEVQDGRLGVAEGIETALSVVASGAPCWACVDASNLQRLPILAGVNRLDIWADNDRSNVGQDAASQLANRWTRAGKEVRVLIPDQVGADWNDVARSRG
jgi:phage/plasmid primase-like uncharacterized protein